MLHPEFRSLTLIYVEEYLSVTIMNLWEDYIAEYFGEGAFTDMFLTFHATNVWSES